jgi:hypothetical protein
MTGKGDFIQNKVFTSRANDAVKVQVEDESEEDEQSNPSDDNEQFQSQTNLSEKINRRDER